MRLQEEGLEEIAQSFSEIPKYYLELQPKEVRTMPVLSQIGKQLFGQQDITEVLFHKDIYLITRDQEEYSSGEPGGFRSAPGRDSADIKHQK